MSGSGAYILVLEVRKRFSTVIGGLGPFDFDRGLYAYIGSAKRSINSRVERHMRVADDKTTKPHWHIDYLLTNSHVRILGVYLHPAWDECTVAGEVCRSRGAGVPVPRFGTGDCTRRCPAHLFRLDDPTVLEKITPRGKVIVPRCSDRERGGKYSLFKGAKKINLYKR